MTSCEIKIWFIVKGAISERCSIGQEVAAGPYRAALPRQAQCLEGSAQEIMDGNLGIYKGAVYENIIADIFTKNAKNLYYFERDANVPAAVADRR